MDILTVGNTVTIKVRNALWDARHRYAAGVVGPEFNEYTGTIVRQKWFKEDQIGITSDVRGLPFRVIDRERIVEVNGAKSTYTPVIHQRETKVVQGSKGNSYVVTRDGKTTTCTCPGFQYRKTCKHAEQAFA